MMHCTGVYHGFGSIGIEQLYLSPLEHWIGIERGSDF
jgi:hypothetical protein